MNDTPLLFETAPHSVVELLLLVGRRTKRLRYVTSPIKSANAFPLNTLSLNEKGAWINVHGCCGPSGLPLGSVGNDRNPQTEGLRQFNPHSLCLVPSVDPAPATLPVIL